MTKDDAEDIPDEAAGPGWWEIEVIRRRRDTSEHGDVAMARGRYLNSARPCPDCGSPPAELAWIWFESSPESWRHLAGRAGWITVCDACRREVDFFLEILN